MGEKAGKVAHTSAGGRCATSRYAMRRALAWFLNARGAAEKEVIGWHGRLAAARSPAEGGACAAGHQFLTLAIPGSSLQPAFVALPSPWV